MEGDPVRAAHGLPRLPGQRARVRDGGREAARHRGAAEGDLDAHAARRAQPRPLAPRLARHLGARAGGDLAVLVHVPRARPGARPLRDGRRDAHAHAVLPGRRPGRGHPARLLRRVPEVLRDHARRRRRVRAAARRSNEIWLKRTKGVGLLSADDAIALGQSGPVLRGSGVDWDLRRAQPYLAYDQVEFDVPVYYNGDVWDRYKVHMDEMRESTRIVVPGARGHARRARGSPTTARSCCRRARSCTPRWRR